MQGRCQKRKQFDSVYYDEKQDWGIAHLACRAELGAWDDGESECFMCYTGYTLFCEVRVAFFNTCKPTNAACEFSTNPYIINQKKPHSIFLL